MAIEFIVDINEPFRLSAWATQTASTVAALVGGGPYDVAIHAEPLDDSEALDPAELSDATLGEFGSSLWFSLTLVPDVEAVGSYDGLAERDLGLVSVRAGRIEDSLVLAISAAIAAASLTRGAVGPGAEGLSGEPLASPEELIEALRVTTPVGSLRRRSRTLLARTPDFGRWFGCVIGSAGRTACLGRPTFDEVFELVALDTDTTRVPSLDQGVAEGRVDLGSLGTDEVALLGRAIARAARAIRSRPSGPSPDLGAAELRDEELTDLIDLVSFVDEHHSGAH